MIVGEFLEVDDERGLVHFSGKPKCYGPLVRFHESMRMHLQETTSLAPHPVIATPPQPQYGTKISPEGE